MTITQQDINAMIDICEDYCLTEENINNILNVKTIR